MKIPRWKYEVARFSVWAMEALLAVLACPLAVGMWLMERWHDKAVDIVYTYISQRR